MSSPGHPCSLGSDPSASGEEALNNLLGVDTEVTIYCAIARPSVVSDACSAFTVRGPISPSISRV